MLRASALALVFVVSSCSVGVIDTSTDSSAALEAAANRPADGDEEEDRDNEDRDDDDGLDDGGLDDGGLDDDGLDDDGLDDDDGGLDDDGLDDDGRNDDGRGDDDLDDDVLADDDTSDDDGLENADTSDNDDVPGDTDVDAAPFTHFVLAGMDAPAGADACAIGCDDNCTSCHATSLGPVCGEPVGRGAMCLSISDAVLQFVDGPPVCPSTATPCAPGLDCLIVSFGYSVAGQCLPGTGHTAGEYCGVGDDCVDGLRCVVVGLHGGICTP
jgi:hypothetical protein